MTSDPGIEPGPHWSKASALTTAPTLLLFARAKIQNGCIEVHAQIVGVAYE